MVAVLAGAVGGCSIAFQSKPVKGQTRAQSGCSTSHVPWVVDAVTVAASAAAVTYAVIRRGEPEANLVGGVGAMGGILYLASAGNGYRWRSQCAASETAAVAIRE